MYQRITTILSTVLFLSLGNLHAQGLGFDLRVGLNVGGSELFHNTRFRSTTLYDLYDFTRISYLPEDYSWEEFESDYQLRQRYAQPRFGFSGHLTFQQWPVFLTGEVMSSPSTYERMAFSLSGGLGKDFLTHDKKYIFTFNSGYKFIYDNGFGAVTLVNSIGNKEAREAAATFFDPGQSVGQPRGHLFTMRLGAGRDLGWLKIIRVGVEAYGELDLTPKIKRASRMSTIGVQAYLRFLVFQG